MAVTFKGMTDRLPVRRSGDTSAMKLFILGVILSLPMLLYSKKDATPWIFQQDCLTLSVKELDKNRPRKLLDQLKLVEYMGRAWVQEQRGWMLPTDKQKCFYCHKQLKNCCPTFFLVEISLDWPGFSVRQGLSALNVEKNLGDTLP